MTTIQARTAPGPGAGALHAADPGSAGRLRGRLATAAARMGSGLGGTPGRMRVVASACVLASLLFGLAAGQAFRSADGALRRAAANTDQLVRVQEIRTNLMQADADATNAFLLDGLEPVDQRDQYRSAVASASRLVAEAAQHQPADGAALGVLNDSLVVYTGQVEQARANNRQALPVGATYLKGASADLRSRALPLLANLGAANTDRVAEEFARAGQAVLWIVVPGLLTLAVLGVALLWLARRTRRYVNLPLAAGALLVLGTVAVGAVGLATVKHDVDTVRDGVYAATLSTTRARIAGFDAKANESLNLVARGSGDAFEDAWQESSAAVTAEITELGRNTASSGLDPLPWPQYATVHQQIRRLDRSGKWEKAVELATSTRPGTGNGTFDAFDASSHEQLAALNHQTAQQLAQGLGWLPLAGALGVLAGVLAAVCSWWGMSLRLEEYR